jgi:CopG family transcriptional regulator/antitoxin EndoAI
MSKRINIILPDKTVAVLDRVTTPGNRSRFIDRAVKHFIESGGKANLRERLKKETMANADRDLAIAAEWFPLEKEAARIGAPGRRAKRSRKLTANWRDLPVPGRDLPGLL